MPTLRELLGRIEHDRFVGRTDELADLERWLGPAASATPDLGLSGDTCLRLGEGGHLLQ